MQPIAYLWMGIAVSIGAYIQGTVGFAFGIFAIPMLVWCGLELPNAVALVQTLVVVQTAFGCAQHWKEIPWREVFILSTYRLIAVPIGVYLLVQARNLPPDRIKQFVGAMLLAAVAFQLGFRPKPRPSLHRAWAAVAGLASGVLAGLVGMGGPPVVMWTMSHDWSTLRARVCLWAMFLLISPWQLSIYAWKFGADSIGHSMLLGLLFSPFVMVMSSLGTLTGSYCSMQRLRRIVYGMLVVIGLTSLLAPYLSR